jgi:predicted GIY-YIG superfamily endonuclease
MSVNKVHTIPDWNIPTYPTKKKVTPKKKPPIDPFAFSHEDRVLRERTAELQRLINQYTQERQELISQLKRREELRNTSRLRTVQLYVLRLEDDCWYVGMTYNPLKRFKAHKDGKGAQWTKVHPPIEIHEIRPTEQYIQDRAARLEDDLTLEYAMLYGPEYVRGGGYCQARPLWPDMVTDR